MVGLFHNINHMFHERSFTPSRGVCIETFSWRHWLIPTKFHMGFTLSSSCVGPIGSIKCSLYLREFFLPLRKRLQPFLGFPRPNAAPNSTLVEVQLLSHFLFSGVVFIRYNKIKKNTRFSYKDTLWNCAVRYELIHDALLYLIEVKFDAALLV